MTSADQFPRSDRLAVRCRRLVLLVLIVACGSDGPTSPAMVPIPEFASIEAGSGYTCALTGDGSVWCWGVNAYGRFGAGAGSPAVDARVYTPTPAASGIRFAALSVGSEHACGIGFGNIVYCWGDNYFGSLGDGDAPNTFRTAPTLVQGSLAFLQVDAAWLHTCGVTVDGLGYCWGYNSVGQLGTGDQVSTNVPTAVAGGLVFRMISSRRGSSGDSDQNSCGLTLDGAAWCWGGNQGGALGNGSLVLWSVVPVPVSGGRTYVELSASAGFVCGITSAAELYCWGRGTREPAPISGGGQWALVRVGASHNCGITVAGQLYCWGANEYGQLGLGTNTPATVSDPALVAGGLTWRTVTVGVFHTCAIATNGTTWCWGAGDQGELGIGALPPHPPDSLYYSPRPVRVATSRPVG